MATKTDYSQSFLATWAMYPKRNGQKRGKRASFVEWEKLTLEDQRAAYTDIKARNMAGGWEFVRDMERYLKRREWEDEWQGKRVKSDPDLIDAITTVTAEQIIDHALQHFTLCNHQVQRPWSYYGPEPGIIGGAVIPACKPCGKSQHRVTTADIPA